MTKKHKALLLADSFNTIIVACSHGGGIASVHSPREFSSVIASAFGHDGQARRQFLCVGAAWAASLAAPHVALASSPAPRRRSALLVGVSEYPTLSRRQQLAGPKNDVAAWLRYFEKHAPFFMGENIDVVADGVAFPGALLPTRANIIGALDRAVSRAELGGFQLVYFAGHGSQMVQPAGAAYPEADGLDEIFLPRDIGRWDGSAGRVLNAVVDDEIGDRLDAIRARGTDVFAVFDCCHAATMARADAMTKTRAVSALDLGMPAPATQPQIGNAKGKKQLENPGHPAARGALTVFYAAHSHQSATEEHLPRLTALRAAALATDQTTATPTWRGVFSFHLIEALSSHRSPPSNEFDFRELAQTVSDRYVREQRVTPVPRYEFLAKLKG